MYHPAVVAARLAQILASPIGGAFKSQYGTSPAPIPAEECHRRTRQLATIWDAKKGPSRIPGRLRHPRGAAMAEVELCRKCKKRPSMPSCVARQFYCCARCRNQTPAAQARIARYFQSDKRKAVMRKDNAKRLFVGAVYHSRVTTGAEAAAINAHIRERVRAYAAES